MASLNFAAIHIFSYDLYLSFFLQNAKKYKIPQNYHGVHEWLKLHVLRKSLKKCPTIQNTDNLILTDKEE